MWYVNYLLFVGLGVLFILIALWKEFNDFWNILASFISSVFFLVVSLAQMEIAFPYHEMLSNDTVIIGVHTYTSPISPYLTYLWFGLFVVLQIYAWVTIFGYTYEKENPGE